MFSQTFLILNYGWIWFDPFSFNTMKTTQGSRKLKTSQIALHIQLMRQVIFKSILFNFLTPQHKWVVLHFFLYPEWIKASSFLFINPFTSSCFSYNNICMCNAFLLFCCFCGYCVVVVAAGTHLAVGRITNQYTLLPNQKYRQSHSVRK